MSDKEQKMKQKNTRWLALWLVIASAVILITGTFAAYTRAEYVKRVVASKHESVSYIFSSNYMYLRDSSSTEYPLRMIPVSTQADVGITITVCNYLQSDLTRVNDETINYKFTAQLVDSNGESLTADKLSIYRTLVKIDNHSLNESGIYTTNAMTLKGGAVTTHFYEITCSKENVERLNEFCIQIQAVPEGSSQGKLVALLKLYSGAKSETPWSGKFVEVTDESMDTTEFDAFNYVISGTTKANMRISWDNSRVTLSPWSLALFKTSSIIHDEAQGKDYIDISVDETVTSYTLQFYRVNGTPNEETGETVNGYVSFETFSGNTE